MRNSSFCYALHERDACVNGLNYFYEEDFKGASLTEVFNRMMEGDYTRLYLAWALHEIIPDTPENKEKHKAHSKRQNDSWDIYVHGIDLRTVYYFDFMYTSRDEMVLAIYDMVDDYEKRNNIPPEEFDKHILKNWDDDDEIPPWV